MLEQSDGTAWMAKYCLNMLEMALRLANHDRAYEDIAIKFFEHFASIAAAMNELWDETDGFFYDRLRKPDGQTIVVRARSMVGLLPVFASVQLPSHLVGALAELPRAAALVHRQHAAPDGLRALFHPRRTARSSICLVDKPRLQRVLSRMFDENEFLSPYGLRSLSRYHRDHPLVIDLGGVDTRLDYEPAESTTPLFGGNSNWRGPVWFPLNLLADRIAAERCTTCSATNFTIELPTGSGKRAHLGAAADEIERRLIRLFLKGADGRRPADGAQARCSSPAPHGRSARSSTNISTATQARASAPRIRPAGPRSSPR